MAARPPSRLARALPALAIPLLLAAASGCVRRTLEITSEPSGAQVVVNGHQAGFTPVKLGFRFNGVYLIELRKGGCLPVRAGAAVPSKFYEFAGPDFVAEVLYPGVIVDQRTIHYRLEPQPPLDKEKLMAASRRAAEEARRLIPELEAAPPPNPNAKDSRLLTPPGKGGASGGKAKAAPEAPKPEAKPAPPARTIPEPEDVPEIEKQR